MRSLSLPLLLLTLTFPAPAQEPVVVPMKVASGARSPTRDPRLYCVPAKCDGKEADFIWGCAGWTIVTESFARQAGLLLKNDPETAGIVDASGQPMYLGAARADVRFGNRQHLVDVKVQRDSPENKGISGTIGYDIACQFQWQLDPGKLELTLRELGASPPDNALATLPLKEEKDNLWVTVRSKGQAADFLLMPQSTDTQVTKQVQALWSISPARPAPPGAVVPHVLRGDDQALELGGVKEANLVVMLLPEVEGAQPGVGASLLNRFVYSVDAKRKELVLMSRVPATGPPRQPAQPR